MTSRLHPMAWTLPAGLALAAALLGVLAVHDPLIAIAASLGVAFIGLTLVDLAAGVVLFTFAASLFEAVPELSSVSLAKGLGVVIVVSWVAALAMQSSREQLFVRHGGFTVLLVLLVTWALVGVIWSDAPATTLSNVLRLALNVLLVPIVFAAVRTSKELGWMLGAFIAGVLGSTFYGLVLSPASIDTSGRLGGAGIDPNYLALWLVAAGVMAVALAARRRTGAGLRLLLIIAVILCAAGIMDTASRGGLVSLAAVVLVAPLLAGPRRRGATAAVAALGAVTVLIAFLAFAPAATLSRITHSDGGSGRTDIWKVGMRMADANLAGGVGLGNFQRSSVHYLLQPGLITRSVHIVDEPKAAHNIYLELLAETGVVGLGLYLAVAGFCLTAAGRAARRFAALGRGDDELMARGIMLATIAVLVGSTFLSLEYAKPLWLLLALGPAALGIAERARRSAG